MLAGAAMASAPAVRTAPSGARAGTGFRGALGSRAGLIAPTARRPNPRASPQPVRAGEALDWENDDFVPASKANKKKKSKGGNAAQAKKQKSKPAAPAAEALDWENDDFVPAGKAKKNKKKPKKGGDDAAEEPAPPPVVAEVPDWENEEFVPASKKKDKKGKKGKGKAPDPEPVAAVAEPITEPEPVAEEPDAAAEAAVAAQAAAKAAEAAAAAAAAQADAAAAAAAAAQAKAEAEAAKAKAEADAAAAAAAATAATEPDLEPDVEEEVEEIDDAALEKATKAAIKAAEEEERRLEEEKLAAIDWTAPDEEVDDGNPIPMHLRDIFAKDAKPSKRRSSGTGTTGVRLEGLKKSFKGMEVLSGCSWDCKKGEKVGLVGWNGAGKTTQLRIIMGEMEADEGEVMLADKVKIGYLTQEFEVKESNTVREEFMSAFGEESVVIKNTERIQKALENEPNMDLMTILLEKLDELQKQADRLDLFNMERAIDKIMPQLGFVPEDNDRLVASFSGGWQMRISLGKILLQEPGLLLMDEPTNHLDLDAIQWLE